MIGTRVLDRYVVKEFTRLFVLFVLAAPMLFILGDLTDHLDTYMDRQLTWGAIGLGYVYSMPQYMLCSFPIAALIATVFTVGNMTRHSEMAAAKAGGISFYRVLATLPLLGILLTAAGLVLSEVVPVAEQARLHVTKERNDIRGARTNFVFRSRSGNVYAIRFLDVERGRIEGLTVTRQGDEKTNPSLAIVASSANFDPKSGWTLHEGYQRQLMGPGHEKARHFVDWAPGYYETPLDLLAQPKEPSEMRYAELGQFIETMRRSGAEPRDLEVDRAQKIAIPVATLIIILFAAPLANSSSRGGPAYGIGISLAITVLYLMAFRLCAAAGATGAMQVDLAAWLPNIALLVAGGGLLTRVRT